MTRPNNIVRIQNECIITSHDNQSLVPVIVPSMVRHNPMTTAPATRGNTLPTASAQSTSQELKPEAILILFANRGKAKAKTRLRTASSGRTFDACWSQINGPIIST